MPCDQLSAASKEEYKSDAITNQLSRKWDTEQELHQISKLMLVLLGAISTEHYCMQKCEMLGSEIKKGTILYFFFFKFNYNLSTTNNKTAATVKCDNLARLHKTPIEKQCSKMKKHVLCE